MSAESFREFRSTEIPDGMQTSMNFNVYDISTGETHVEERAMPYTPTEVSVLEEAHRWQRPISETDTWRDIDMPLNHSLDNRAIGLLKLQNFITNTLEGIYSNLMQFAGDPQRVLLPWETAIINMYRSLRPFINQQNVPQPPRGGFSPPTQFRR